MAKYVVKPVVFEATQATEECFIRSPFGTQMVSVGDWVVSRTIISNGTVVKFRVPDSEFKETYEKVEEE